MGLKKVTCDAKSQLNWCLTDKSGTVWYNGTANCGALITQNKLFQHHTSVLCAGHLKFFVKLDGLVKEKVRLCESGVPVPGLHIDPDGVKPVCLDEDFRQTPEWMELTKEILTNGGFHNAVKSSQQLTMFFVTALADGIVKHLDKVNKSLVRIIEAFKVRGVEAFTFLGINCIDADVMEDVFANMAEAVVDINKSVNAVKADVVEMKQDFVVVKGGMTKLREELERLAASQQLSDDARARMAAEMARYEEMLNSLNQAVPQMEQQMRQFKVGKEIHDSLLGFKEEACALFEDQKSRTEELLAKVEQVQQRQQEQQQQQQLHKERIDAQALQLAAQGAQIAELQRFREECTQQWCQLELERQDNAMRASPGSARRVSTGSGLTEQLRASLGSVLSRLSPRSGSSSSPSVREPSGSSSSSPRSLLSPARSPPAGSRSARSPPAGSRPARSPRPSLLASLRASLSSRPSLSSPLSSPLSPLRSPLRSPSLPAAADAEDPSNPRRDSTEEFLIEAQARLDQMKASAAAGPSQADAAPAPAASPSASTPASDSASASPGAPAAASAGASLAAHAASMPMSDAAMAEAVTCAGIEESNEEVAERLGFAGASSSASASASGASTSASAMFSPAASTLSAGASEAATPSEAPTPATPATPATPGPPSPPASTAQATPASGLTAQATPAPPATHSSAQATPAAPASSAQATPAAPASSAQATPAAPAFSAQATPAAPSSSAQSEPATPRRSSPRWRFLKWFGLPTPARFLRGAQA